MAFVSSRFLSSFIILVGTALGIAALVQGQAASEAIGFFALFIIGPWIVAATMWLKSRNSLGLAIGVFLMLLLEIAAYYQTFVHPTGSTDALIYVVKPFYQLVMCLPGGFILASLSRFLRTKLAAKN